MPCSPQSRLPYQPAIASRIVAVLICAVACGCSTERSARPPAPAQPAAGASAQPRVQTADLSVRLIGTVGEDDAGSLVRDPGWREYLLAIENLGAKRVMIRNVKLLTPEGRYLDSASDYDQLAVPPDAATEVATDVARRSAGIAAGQVIPYGGAIVGILSSAVTASATQAKANARGEFVSRRLKDVELAPGGKANGSAFLPNTANPTAVVLDLELAPLGSDGRGDRTERLRLPLNAAD